MVIIIKMLRAFRSNSSSEPCRKTYYFLIRLSLVLIAFSAYFEEFVMDDDDVNILMMLIMIMVVVV